MILTQCAVCATDLGLSLGKKCGRCSTRYCGPACQEQHWKEGGHDQLCKKIKRAGGAEQYNANTKYAEAVAVAAEACAEDTKGQTCYICTQALHWKTKEGLVRMCACRGTAGFAHVSCLAEQAKILVAEVEKSNLDCKGNLAITYKALGRNEEALRMRRDVYSGWSKFLGEEDERTLRAAHNYADSLETLKRFEEAKSLLRRTVPVARRVLGESHETTLRARWGYAAALYNNTGATLDDLREAVSTLAEIELIARRVLGGAHPGVVNIERVLRRSREVLSAREGGDVESTREALEAMTAGDAN